MPIFLRTSRSSRCGSVSTFRPSISTWPSVGISSALTMRSNVDFPAPLNPMTPNISPSWIVSDTCCNARTVSFLTVKVLLISKNLIMSCTPPLIYPVHYTAPVTILIWCLFQTVIAGFRLAKIHLSIKITTVSYAETMARGSTLFTAYHAVSRNP